MAYNESTTSGGGTSSTEKSIKSCYAVVYNLDNRKWVVSGEGGWSEVHLCHDSSDNTHRILAWTVKSQQVLMNCNVTAECVYKEKSKNFHSFSDENGNRYGLGFHKSESGLKQATHYLKAVVAVIQQCKDDINPSAPQSVAHDYQQQKPQSSATAGYGTVGGGGGMGGMPPPHEDEESVSEHYTEHHQSQQNHYHQAQAQANQNEPPMFSQTDNNNNGYHQAQQNQASYHQPMHAPPQAPQQAKPLQPVQPIRASQVDQNPGFFSNSNGMLSPEPSSPRAKDAAPTYHLSDERYKSIPTGQIGPLGNLKILPPKKQKHFGGDKRIKNPTTVEHVTRVTHDKETGLYTGLPAEWMEELNKQFGVNPKQLPGVQFDQYPSKIPKVLVTLRNALEEADGYQQVGIFRLAPNASDNKAIKEKINKGQLAENNEEKIDVNVYANLIKVWFRDLPDPLLNCVNPDLIEHVNNQNDAQNVISQFPEPNKSIFLWLCDMCVEIAQYEKTNKMGAQNMAIVVGPNLFNTDRFENPMKAMTYSGKVVEFFKHAILWRANSMQQ